MFIRFDMMYERDIPVYTNKKHKQTHRQTRYGNYTVEVEDIV